MSRATLRKLIRILRPAGKHSKRVLRQRFKREALEADMAWLGELFPTTLPPEPGPDEPWQPRVARCVRVMFWIPDDTIIDGLSPIHS